MDESLSYRQRQGAIPAPDLLQRDFTAERPHQVWTSDITSIWTTEGWLYLAVILSSLFPGHRRLGHQRTDRRSVGLHGVSAGPLAIPAKIAGDRPQ